MTSFGCVPFASVCPCARCVDAITSLSSSARHTPTATASWPIATWRKPGSSPARKRSSTFSSKRRMSSISRRKSLSVSRASACVFFSAVAIGRTLASSTVKLGEQWTEILERAAARLGARRGRASASPSRIRWSGSRSSSARCPTARRFLLDVERDGETVGLNPDLVTRALLRLDSEGVVGELSLGDVRTEHHALAEEWRGLVDALPADWSHLLAQVDLDSSDFVDRAAMLIGPTNPVLADGVRALQFRSARLRRLRRLGRDGRALSRAARRREDHRADLDREGRLRRASGRHAGPGVARRRPRRSSPRGPSS